MAAATSLALMAASAASNTVGSYYTAKGQQATLRYQAGIADTNARLSELGAQTELARGQREEQSSRLKTAHLKSAQRVALAANGVDLGQGSALDALTSTDYMGEVDANTIAANAVRSAWGYLTQGMNYKNEALTKRATAGAINPGMSAATTLLGQAGQVAASWYALDKAGAFAPSDVVAANKTADPIGSLGASRGWWSK
jgi:hypothetical protein